jgi:hypothetical protein
LQIPKSDRKLRLRIRALLTGDGAELELVRT